MFKVVLSVLFCENAILCWVCILFGALYISIIYFNIMIKSYARFTIIFQIAIFLIIIFLIAVFLITGIVFQIVVFLIVMFLF